MPNQSASSRSSLCRSSLRRRSLRRRALGFAAAYFLALTPLLPACRAQGAASNTGEHPPAATSKLSSKIEARTLAKLLERNLRREVSLPEDFIDEQLSNWRRLPVGQRVAKWAELFLERADATYVFGLKPGGYVADSLIVQDFKQDCVLFSYRCTDLAQSSSAREALLRGLDSRFRGGLPTEVVRATGAVDYNHPAHLDYSLDIVRSGLWGEDVTSGIGVVSVDSVGTSRYPAGSFSYIPTEALRQKLVMDGDLLFFIFDENSERGRKLRNQYGLVVGHQGIAQWVDGTLHVIHAASSDLAGEYEGNRVVRLPILTYLRRVESFKGVIVTRLAEEPN